jgi:hypothetical protein
LIRRFKHALSLDRRRVLSAALLLCSSYFAHGQARYIFGVVETEDGRRLAGVSVRVTNVGDRPTSNSGEFRIPLPPEFDPGTEIEFYIAGWTIKSPYQARDWLPKVPTTPMHIIVARAAVSRRQVSAPAKPTRGDQP